MDNENTVDHLTEDEEEMAWEVNALLMALHEGSMDLYESIVLKSENVAGLFLLANATLKSMIDALIETANATGAVSISFPELIQCTAQFLTEMKTDE